MNQGKKKILLVVSTLNTGGAQRAFANMSMEFSAKWDCDFLLNDAQNISYPYSGRIIDLGMKPTEDKTGILYQLNVLIRRYLKLRKLKQSGDYVACISALTSANAVNVLTGNHYCKTVISVRIFMSKMLQDERGYKRWLKKWTMRCLANKADYVVAVSESARQDLVWNFNVKPEKAVAIHNGYILDNIRSLAAEALSEEQLSWFRQDVKTIVSVGRLVEEKGHDHLIRAFHMVKERIPDVRLLILGKGEEEANLIRLIDEYHLDEDVVLCGFVKNPYKIVSKCDLFVLPSHYEGFPNVLAESLCLGVPAVATDCDSGAREILAPDTEISYKITHGFEEAKYGILCPVCEAETGCADDQIRVRENDMAEAMIHMLQNQDVYKHYQEMTGERADQLSMKNVMRQWINLIER